MNKISKKIVALVTMAAFVLTLVPMAAFAAYGSTVSVASDDQEINFTGSAVTADVTVDVNATDASKAGNVYVWVEKDNKVYPYATFKVDGSDIKTSGKTGDLAYAGAIRNISTPKAYVVEITLPEAGDYKVFAGIEPGDAGSAMSTDSLQVFGVNGSNSIVVKDTDVEVTDINNITSDGNISINYTPNSVKKVEVSADVVAEYVGTDNHASSEGKVITIDNGNNAAKGLYVFAKGTENAIDEVTVDANGKIAFDIKAMSGAKAGKYTITLSADGVTKNLTVTVKGETEVAKIEAVDTDSEYVSTTANPDFAGVAEVVFKDANGNVVNTLPTEVKKGSANNYQIISQPEGSDVNVTNFGLESVGADSDNYKLTYTGTLKAGEYTIRIALDNGSNVELSFKAAKIGKTVALDIDVDNDAETIVSGGTVTGTVYAIDANGIKTAAKQADVKLGFVNSAAVNTDNGSATNVNLGTNGKFTVQAKSDEKYYGSKITLFAFDEEAKVQATKELTVVDGLSNNTLAFDSESGSVAKDNTVTVSVVDENGKVVDIDNGNAFVYVESTSNEDAKVDASFNGNKVQNGKVKLTVYSSEETTADIVVAVKDPATKAIYANTLKYTFGEQDIAADTTVVMTIGSADFVVNNAVVNVPDAAPYIANDRTYVPFRALGEAIGAEVVWDNDARTVTYTLGKTEVVMTIGEKTYTVNGEEKTMDVAPVITGDRTYVPVRFVGEALGFKVTALSAADGTTSSVVFQK